jgi:GNAT superfamily N-acetyltransferase
MQACDATIDQLNALTDIWFEGWRSGHQEHVPPALTKLRTSENFRERLTGYLPRTRVVTSENGEVLGFHLITDDQLYQFYVSAASRGQGVAAVLMNDALTQLRGAGVKTAWLACAVGNDRAARFYEKSGWTRTGTVTEDVETSTGDFPLQVWRYEIEV